jgi:fucose permease
MAGMLQARPRAVAATSVLAVAAFVALGLPDGVLGVAWPSMRDGFDQPVGALGLVVAAGTAGYLASTVANGPLLRRLGTARHLLASLGCLVVALAGIALAPGFPVVLAAAALLGLGGGALDAGLNSYVAVHGGLRLMNLLHASYGVGTTMGPVLATVAVAGGSWRAAYAAAALVAGALAAAVAAGAGAWLPLAGRDDRPDAPAGSAAGSRLVAWLLLVLFFVYTGVELMAGQWAFTLLHEGRGATEAAAGAWVSLYWGAFTAGRLLAGALGERVAPERLVDASIAASVVAAAVIWWDPGGAGALGFPLLGLSLAAVFPALVALTPGRLGTAHAPTAIGRQLAAAGLGGAALVAAAGAAAERFGIDALAPSLFVASVAMAAVHLATAWAVGRRPVG